VTVRTFVASVLLFLLAGCGAAQIYDGPRDPIYVLVGIWVLVQIVLLFWVSKAMPSRALKAKYKKKFIFQSGIPFMHAWRAHIESEDLKILEEHRRRFFIQYYVFFLVPVALFYFYLYMKYFYWGTRL